jgi:hypothetical protein
MFTISLLLVCLANVAITSDSYRKRRKAKYVLIVGSILAFLCYNVLVFDIFLTFKNFRRQETWRRFMSCCCYVIGAPLAFFLIGRYFNLSGIFYLSVIYDLFHPFSIEIPILGSIALDVFFFLVTGVMIFKISKSSKVTEHALFLAETNR